MDGRGLKKAYRNGWILVLAALVFVVLVFAYALRTNEPAQPPTWNMGGKPFVPASSTYGNGAAKAECERLGERLQDIEPITAPTPPRPA